MRVTLVVECDDRKVKASEKTREERDFVIYFLLAHTVYADGLFTYTAKVDVREELEHTHNTHKCVGVCGIKKELQPLLVIRPFIQLTDRKHIDSKAVSSGR